LALVSKDLATKKMQVNHCLINFSRSDDLKEFDKTFDEALEELKKQSGKPVKKVD
jgi:hypothetical protein